MILKDLLGVLKERKDSAECLEVNVCTKVKAYSFDIEVPLGNARLDSVYSVFSKLYNVEVSELYIEGFERIKVVLVPEKSS